MNSHETGVSHGNEHAPIKDKFEAAYDYAVIMPYAQNLRENGDQRMTFYTSFVTNATAEMFKAGKIGKIILVGEDTFGQGYKSTSQLQREALIKHGIPAWNIVVLQAKNLNNTPFQIEAVAKYQKEFNTDSQKFAFIDFPFHEQRIQNYIEGYGVKNATLLSAVELHKRSKSKFNVSRFNAVGRFREFEARETGFGSLFARQISAIDKKGMLHRFITAHRGGSMVDIEKTRSGRTTLKNISGQQRIDEVKPVSTIVVLGKNIGVGSGNKEIMADPSHLSNESKMAAIAAGMLWEKGKKIIFSTGETTPHAHSEARSMAEYMKARFEVPNVDIILEEKSLDTSGNAEEVVKILKEKKIGQVGIVSVGETGHLRNAKTLFRRYGTRVNNIFASEDLAAKMSDEWKTFVRRWRYSDEVAQEHLKETFRRVLLYTIDPWGKLLRYFAELGRGSTHAAGAH